MKSFLFLSLLLVPLSLADVVQEPLVYEEDSWVNTELRCPSPDGQAELVYRGTRHAERAEISCVTELVLILKNGHEIPLGELFATSPLYRANIIRQPWSPDGKWLVFPISRFAYCFCSVAALSDSCFSHRNVKMLSVAEEYTNIRGIKDGTRTGESRATSFVLDGGRWEADGSFTFRAGLSGYLAPYAASVSEDGVSYQQVGDMVKCHP